MLNDELFSVGGTSFTSVTLILCGSILAATFVVSTVARRALRRKMREDGNENDAAARVTGRLVHYVVVLIGFGTALAAVGVDMGALVAASAIFGVAFGFAMQNIVENFVSGVLLIMERSIRPGDVITVSDRQVRVADIRIRTTLVETLDQDFLIVPNSILVSSVVNNFTTGDPGRRLRILVGVSYEADPHHVYRVLGACASAACSGDEFSDPEVHFEDFGDSALVFEVSVRMARPWAIEENNTTLRFAVWDALKAESIEISYPQLDLHLKAGPGVDINAAG